MIQAKEVRIGNWIKHKDHQLNVIAISPYMISCDPYWGFDKFEDIEGIPLTPKILEKAGAIKRHGNTWFLGKLKFDLNSTGKIIRFHYSGKVAYIDHVHTLQNLVYALTGTELTIEL